MSNLSKSDFEELQELRRYKELHEGKALNRAFSRLQQLIDMSAYDGVQSVRGFRAIAECLICLREEIEK